MKRDRHKSSRVLVQEEKLFPKHYTWLCSFIGIERSDDVVDLNGGTLGEFLGEHRDDFEEEARGKFPKQVSKLIEYYSDVAAIELLIVDQQKALRKKEEASQKVPRCMVKHTDIIKDRFFVDTDNRDAAVAVVELLFASEESANNVSTSIKEMAKEQDNPFAKMAPGVRGRYATKAYFIKCVGSWYVDPNPPLVRVKRRGVGRATIAARQHEEEIQRGVDEESAKKCR